MIQINLIPDVKMELLKARRMRTMVTSISIIVAMAAGGVVALLAFYVFGVQTLLESSADGAIKDEFSKLSEVEDLPKTLTIQNQLDQLESLHSDKAKTSRLFDILTTTVPTGKNKVAISKLYLDREENTIDIEGSAPNGYEALEVFKKTIAQTTFEYAEGGEKKPAINIASEIADGDRNFGEDSEGNNVLRFSLSFSYPDELFSATSENGRIIAPNKQNVTDSVLGVPKSLFTDGAREENE